jgi:hypothetical protein
MDYGAGGRGRAEVVKGRGWEGWDVESTMSVSQQRERDKFLCKVGTYPYYHK